MISELISIIMPIKNEEAYLKDCLDSILAQEYTQWELLAVDDHSSDDTWQILTSYQKRDPRIKILKSTGSGIIPALRSGYAHCRGSYITRMDADDLMTSDKLSTLIGLLDNMPGPSLATAHIEYFSENGIRDGYKKYEFWLNSLCENNTHYQHIYKECVIPSPCWMVDRLTFDKVGGFLAERYPEDYDLAFRFYLHKIPIITSDKILHHWRDYPSRTSRTSSDYSDNRFLVLKAHYFINIDHDHTKPLVLWGAGKKGKDLAQLLINQNISFRWISNNPKKIGKSIYDILIESDSITPDKTAQVILAIANPHEKLKAISSLKQVGHKLGKSLFPFC